MKHVNYIITSKATIPLELQSNITKFKKLGKTNPNNQKITLFLFQKKKEVVQVSC